MDTAHVKQLGELRTEVLHVRSGQRFLTDAPVDNRGRGEAISPTDMLAASLAACCLTTMEIKAAERGVPMAGMQARVVKHMQASPRRVARVEVEITLEGKGLSDDDRRFLEHTAHHCPVALSLASGLEQAITFVYL